METQTFELWQTSLKLELTELQSQLVALAGEGTPIAIDFKKSETKKIFVVIFPDPSLDD